MVLVSQTFLTMNQRITHVSEVVNHDLKEQGSLLIISNLLVVNYDIWLLLEAICYVQFQVY